MSGPHFVPTRQVAIGCRFIIRLERIVSKNNDVLRSNKGGVKGEGIVAELGFVRSATSWLRLTPYDRKLSSPHFVGFANPIEERGLSVVCGLLTVPLRYTVRYSIDSVNWSYFRPVTRLAVRAVG